MAEETVEAVELSVMNLQEVLVVAALFWVQEAHLALALAASLASALKESPYLFFP